MTTGRSPYSSCSGLHRRHWFTRYGHPGQAAAWCERCGAPNPTCIECGARTHPQPNGDAVCTFGHRHRYAASPMRRTAIVVRGETTDA